VPARAFSLYAPQFACKLTERFVCAPPPQKHSFIRSSLSCINLGAVAENCIERCTLRARSMHGKQLRKGAIFAFFH
jgi:hypothetical protein